MKSTVASRTKRVVETKKVVVHAGPAPAAKTPVRKAAPAAAACLDLRVSTKTLRAGQRTSLGLVVRAGGRPAAGTTVILRGPGVERRIALGARGSATAFVTAPTPGIVSVSLLGTRACSGKRIGVIGAVEPTVAG